ncbi:40S ribosomal protein S2-4-like protein [Tanacetum coccineum]
MHPDSACTATMAWWLSHDGVVVVARVIVGGDDVGGGWCCWIGGGGGDDDGEVDLWWGVVEMAWRRLVTGKCGSVTVRLVPAPRGAAIVASRVPEKVLQFAGIDDVFA